MSRTITIAKIAERLKSASSRYIKRLGQLGFTWQTGYAAFSLGQSGVGPLTGYIRNQPTHHKNMSYQAELEAFLRRYEMESLVSDQPKPHRGDLPTPPSQPTTIQRQISPRR